jgi:hypothetical protein
MRVRIPLARLVGLSLLVVPLSAHAAVRAEDDMPRAAALRRIIARATELAALPATIRVQAVDPELAPDPAAVHGLDAFVVREQDGRLRQVIYLNAASDLLRSSVDGSDIHLHLLAAVLVHEAHHLAGASEPEARRAEKAFIETLVAQRRLPPSLTRRYLEELSAWPTRAPHAVP